MSVGSCRSRSKSGCCRIMAASYCGRKGKRKRSRSRRRRSRKSRRRCGRSRRRRGRGRSRRRRRGRSRKKRCARAGPKTNNPFLNYLRVFRRKHCGWPACKIAIEGAKCWCKMNEMERRKYYREACAQRKGKRRKRRGRGRRGKRRRRRRRRRRRGRGRRKKGKCPV